MRTVKIDEQTFNYLQTQAIAFIETPGDTIKRLLGLESNVPIGQDNLPNNDIRAKKRKTNLPELVRAGLLQDGQKLVFQDYRGNRYPEYEVILSGGMLKWEKKSYSMSNLAKRLLKKQGHNNEFVRGPVFWVTSEGKTIADLWDRYLKIKEA